MGNQSLLALSLHKLKMTVNLSSQVELELPKFFHKFNKIHYQCLLEFIKYSFKVLLVEYE